MKIRGESGAVPFRGAMAGGARPVAKAVAKVTAKAKAKSADKAAKSLKKADEKIKTQVIQGNSVRVRTPEPGTPDRVRIARNKEATKMAARRKSGKLAKTTASRVNTNTLGKAAKVVKIKSTDL